MPTTHNVESLPLWAQTEINRLRRSVEDLEAQLAVGPDESDTFVEHVAHGTSTPLGRSPQVAFHVTNGIVTAYTDDQGRLCLHGVGARVSAGLVLRATASNVFIIELGH